MAMECDYPYKELLDEIVNDIQFEVSIGVVQEFRVASNSTNAPSALEYGDRVSDSLCKMMHDRYLMGPFSGNELPFKENRFSGLMVKLKPDGSARMILNLSKGDPVSVNEGINSKNYLTVMSSTLEFVRVLNRCGKNAKITKIDWVSSYKQIRVRKDNVWQQGFKWERGNLFQK